MARLLHSDNRNPSFAGWAGGDEVENRLKPTLGQLRDIDTDATNIHLTIEAGVAAACVGAIIITGVDTSNQRIVLRA